MVHRLLLFALLALVFLTPELKAGTCTNCVLTPASVTICQGSTQNIVLTKSGGPNVNAVAWIYSSTTDVPASYSPAPGSTVSNTYTVPGSLPPGIYYFRARTNGGADTSGVVATITVAGAPNPGTLVGSTERCDKVGTGVVVGLAGHSGTILKWEEKTGGAGSWGMLAGSAGITSYTVPDGTDTMYYRAIVTNGTCNDTSNVATIAVNPDVAGGTLSGGPAESCATSGTFTLTLSGHVGTPVRWEKMQVSEGSWTNMSLAIGTTSHNVTPALTDTTYYRVLLYQPSCGFAFSTVRMINVTASAAVGTAAAIDPIRCSGQSANVYVPSYTGTIQWQERVPPSLVWANVSGSGTGQIYNTGALTQTTEYRAVVTNGACSVNSNTVSVTVTAAPAIGTIPSNVTICSGTNTNLTVSSSTGGVQWQQSNDGITGWINVVGGSGGTSNTYNTPTLTADRYYRVMATTACASVTSNVVEVEVAPDPAVSNFTTPAAICSGTSTAPLGATLNAGTVGVWSCTSCNGGFTNSTDPNAQYVSAPSDNGTIALTWTTISPGCSNDVNSRNLSVTQGPSGTFGTTPPPTCAGDATPPLGATDAVGNGTWSVTPAGSGSFSSLTNGNATFTPNATQIGNFITLRWTVTQGGCPNAIYTQQLKVTGNPSGGIVNASIPTTCVGVPTPTIDSYITVGESGFWSTSGSGSFSPNNTSTSVTYTPSPSDGGNIITLTWNIVSGTCAPQAYSRSMRVESSPVASVPGAPVPDICAGEPTIPLGASATNGTGEWTCSAYWAFNGGTYSCTGFFVDPYDPNTTYQSSVSDWDFDLTFTWTVTNATCGSDADFRTGYVVPFYVSGDFPPLPNSNLCLGERTSFGLNATNLTGTNGVWSCTGCNSPSTQFLDAFGNPDNTDPNAYFQSQIGDGSTVTLNWTVSNASCGSSRTYSQVLNVYPAPVGNIPVGVPPLCAGSTRNVFATWTNGTGLWSTSSGNGSFTAPTSQKTGFTPSPLDGNDGSVSTTNLVCTLSRPGCTSQVLTTPLFIYAPSQGGINDVPDTICVENTAQLDAGTVWGDGLWLTDGQGGFTNSISPTAKYIPLLADTGKKVAVRWVVTNGSCPAAEYTDTIYVRRQSKGAFTTNIPSICEGQTTIPLAAQLINGTGEWSSNGNGFFSDNFDPNATYTAGVGDGNQPIELYWTVTNGACISAVYSRTLNVYKPSQGLFAQAPAPICYGGQTEPLQAIAIFGSGRWHTPDGAGSFSNPVDGNSRYVSANGDQDQTVTLIWRVGNGTCDSVDYVQSVFVNNIVADAGSNVTICVGASTQLQASGGTEYLWLPANGLDNNTIANPIATPDGNITYTVTVGDGTGCFFDDQMTVTVTNQGTVTALASAPDVCQDSLVTLSITGTNLNLSTLVWSPAAPITAGGGNVNSATTTARITATTNFTATVQTNTGCTVTSTVTVNMYPITKPSLISRDNCEREKQFLAAQDIEQCTQIAWFSAPYTVVRAAGPLTTANPYYVGNTPLLLADESSDLGTYTYTLLCENVNGCGHYDQKTYQIIEGPDGDFTADRVSVIYNEREINFTGIDVKAQGGGTGDITRYYWDFGDPASGLANNSTDQNPSHAYSSFGTFTVALYVSTDLNCSELIVKTNYIFVKAPEYSFPTAFTPNADGLNDRFRPLPYEYKPVVKFFRIYDRWDNVVFETTDPEGWPGTDNNGTPMDPGVYTYEVQLDLPELGVRTYNGLIHLLR